MEAPDRAGSGEGQPVGARAVLALTGIGTLAAACFFYPGYLDGDSNWQYAQGVSGLYNDMHPVVMSWLLGRLDGIIEGTGAYFLLMSIAFWAGLGMTLRAFTSSWRGFAIAALVIGTSVPVLTMLGKIQKDLGVVVGMLGTFALLVQADRRRSLAPLLCTLPLLWYAIAVRHNSVTAAVPFALWLGWLLARDHLPPRMAHRFAAAWRRLAIGALVLASLYSTSLLASRAILGAVGERHHIEQVLMAYDLVGISVRSGRSYVSDLYYPRHPLSMGEMRAMYRPETAYFLYWGEYWWRKVPHVSTPRALDRIRRAWLDAILAEPAAYAAHRGTLFLGTLGIGENLPERHIGLPRTHDLFDYRGPTVFEWPHARALIAFFDRIGPTPLFRAWPYLLLGALAAAAAWLWPNRHRFEITLLVASSACYIAPFLIVGVASEFRYMWWPILAAMLQIVLVLDGRRVEPGALVDSRAGPGS